jgi:hypothetical protein
MSIRLTIQTFLLLFSLSAFAQEGQTVRGRVIDKETKQPLIGVSIVVEASEPAIGTATDFEGNFELKNAPLGRQTIVAQFMGYQPYATKDLIITAAKEVFLEIELIEAVHQTGEVEVTAGSTGGGSNRAINELSVVSTRSFSVEETQRYAASINDPGRMVMAFPGVQSNNDTENDIVIRGNSANGVLWRVEGLDIANPNHFARPATSGGGITVFSASLLSNSDFSTGAFAAEYGNAFSGVFDMRFRKGNLQNREYTFRFGLIGVDLAAEGPIKKGRSSYLINARYSTLGILGAMGFYVVRDNVSNNFQDLSFNLYFSTPDNKNMFTIFGIGGLSQENWWMRPVDRWEYNYDYDWNYNSSNLGVLGGTWTHLVNEKSFLKVSAGASISEIYDFQIRPTIEADSVFWLERNDYLNTKFSVHPVYSYKVNPQLRFKAGLISSYTLFDLEYGEDLGGDNYQNYLGNFEPLGAWDINRDAFFEPNTPVNLERDRGSGTTGGAFLQQAYVQGSYRPTENLTLNAGLHAIYLGMNNTGAVDPRLSMRYTPTNTTTLTLGYGLHSKALPFGTYLIQVQDSLGNITQPNQNLKMTRQHHIVGGIEQIFAESFRVQVEPYFQYMFNVPIRTDMNSTYWFYNLRDNYGRFAMTDQGLGMNYGVDLTLEKFFGQGFFILATGSLFRSTFKAWEDEWRSSRLDNLFSTSVMGTKEWAFNQGKGGVLQVGLKMFWRGALRYQQANKPASIAAEYFIEDEPAAFDAQFDEDYFRLDGRIAYRKDYKKIYWTLAVDIQNATDRENARGFEWDRNQQDVVPDANSGLTPVLSFQLDF